MTEHCYWRFSRALHRALNDQYFADIEGLLDDNVEWALYGPIDMFPFLGTRQGKHAVLEVIRNMAGIIQVRRFDREMTILGLNSAASILRCSLVARDSKKPIVLRLAQFAQFEAARLINMRALIDTFELVEQALGRSIHLPNTSGCVTEALDRN